MEERTLTMKRTTLKQVADLPDLTTAQLEEKWRVLFGSEPPQYNRPFLIKRLAYRIQETAYGGVREETREKLNDVLEATGHDAFAAPRKPTPNPPSEKSIPLPGLDSSVIGMVSESRCWLSITALNTTAGCTGACPPLLVRSRGRIGTARLFSDCVERKTVASKGVNHESAGY
jgi:hypothetical protein